MTRVLSIFSAVMVSIITAPIVSHQFYLLTGLNGLYIGTTFLFVGIFLIMKFNK